MSNKLTLNGKTYDLTDREEVVKALNDIKKIREEINFDDCGFFKSFAMSLYDKTEHHLEEILNGFDAELQQQNVKDNVKITRYLAQVYLEEHIDGFNDLDDDQKESFINLISKSFIWLIDKEKEIEENK